MIVTESVVKVNKKYHPQTVLEECKYKVKKRRGKTFFLTHKSSTFSKKNLQSPGTFISGRTWDPSQRAITK